MNSLEFCCKEEQGNGGIRELGTEILTSCQVKEFVNGSWTSRRGDSASERTEAVPETISVVLSSIRSM